MKRAILALAFVAAFAFLPVISVNSADCLYGELPDGGCKPAPGATPTPRPSSTVNPNATPRPAVLSASVVCNPATHYNDVTVKTTYAGSWELWTESDGWFGRKEASGVGAATVVFHWNASFNKAGIFLFAPGVTWPAFQDPNRDPIASVTVHAIWGPSAPGC